MTARLTLAAAVSALCFWSTAPSAFASAEGGCEPDYPSLSSKFMCRDVLATLIPENDTRDNLIFLMADRQKKPFTVWPEAAASEDDGSGGYVGYGTVCVSDGQGGVDFQAALLNDATLQPEEKKQLSAAREALRCEANTAALSVTAQSEAGKAFAAYLAAIDQFYRVSHTDSAPFDALANSSQPWVREAARYMQARIALLSAQVLAFDDWGTLDRTRIDQGMVTKARDGLNAYLKDYPAGAYAASAKGLLRRADWFAGDPGVLASTYSRIVSESEVNVDSVALANEIDQKLPEDSYTAADASPIVLAVQLLRKMREVETGTDTYAYAMKAEELEAYRGRFVGNEGLFDYLLALRTLLVDKDADAVLRMITDAAPTAPMDYLAFSRQMLRGAALEAKDDATVRDLYLALLPQAQNVYQRGTAEMALAKYEERHKNMSFLFEEGSPLQNTDIRIRLLDRVAGPIILKMQATSATAPKAEREAALYRLLFRDLTQGRFKGFLSDIKLMPPVPEANEDGVVDDRFDMFRWAGGDEDGYACPGLVDVAKALATNPKDVKGRLCLGDFYLANYIEEDLPPEPDQLGGTGTLFAGAFLKREDFYREIMKDPKARREDRAYALFRAVHCYQGTNTCGGPDVPLKVRKGWHDELKARYGDTFWAKKLRYYW